MSQFPVDPALAKMILVAADQGEVDEDPMADDGTSKS